MTTWSKMQEKAIYTKDKNILVSASAGSGKTTVLIARLLNLIQNEKIEINSDCWTSPFKQYHGFSTQNINL